MHASDDAIIELLSRCARGDSAALRTLYDLAAPQLFAVLLRILHRADLAEDALQEVFMSIWRNAVTFDVRRGHPMAWMITIARYRAIDVRRRRRFEQSEQDVADVQDKLVAETGDPSSLAALSADTQRLADCMGRLNESQDRCIRLAFIEGLSHEEVARKVSSPIGSVKSWIRRGLLALKDCLVS
jgi:RNA polymerase sigma-70 factor (ECF subfamily)